MPNPLKRLQARRLYDPEDLKQLLQELAKKLRRNLKPFTQKIGTLAKRAKDLTGGWESVQPARVAARSDLSPFRFEAALATAQKHVFVAGQNLYSLAGSEEHRKSLLDFLRAGHGRQVDVLFCDANNETCVSAWAQVNPEQPGIGFTYKDHLRVAAKGFSDLLREARKIRLPGLNVKVLPVIPIGVTVVDPELVTGVMALQPVINHGYKSPERPQFLISKAGQPEVFRYYWLNLKTAFDSAKDLLRETKGGYR